MIGVESTESRSKTNAKKSKIVKGVAGRNHILVNFSPIASLQKLQVNFHHVGRQRPRGRGDEKCFQPMSVHEEPTVLH
jgi:hypothetical protein